MHCGCLQRRNLSVDVLTCFRRHHANRQLVILIALWIKSATEHAEVEKGCKNLAIFGQSGEMDYLARGFVHRSENKIGRRKRAAGKHVGIGAEYLVSTGAHWICDQGFDQRVSTETKVTCKKPRPVSE